MGLTLDLEAYSDVELRPLIQGILDEVSLCTISSVNADGTAHANTAFFCMDAEWRMYFMSSKEAQHSRNIMAPVLAGGHGVRFKTGLGRLEKRFAAVRSVLGGSRS